MLIQFFCMYNMYNDMYNIINFRNFHALFHYSILDTNNSLFFICNNIRDNILYLKFIIRFPFQQIIQNGDSSKFI